MDEEAVNRILGDRAFNPEARRFYDCFRGGFMWDDEFPERGKDDFRLAIPILAHVIAYRASLTLGEPALRWESAWHELRAILPSWPGFREERICGAVERDLRAAKLREDRCFARLEREFDQQGT